MPKRIPIRVGFNLLYIRPGIVGGTETYARELLAALSRLEVGFEYVLFLNPAAAKTFSHFDPDRRFQTVPCSAPTRPWLRHVWEQVNFPWLCRKHRLDLLHSPGYVTPLLPRCAKVVNVHDMIYRAAPHTISVARRWFWSVMIPASAQVSDAVITGSQSAHDYVLAYLRLPPAKVHVTPYGPGQKWPEAAPWGTTKAKYALPDEFFLAVGAGAHKRLDVARDALERLRVHHGVRIPLLVTGNGTSADHNNGDNLVRRLGFIPAEDLTTLYSRAIALVCSSEMEGFGLPVLEALGAGTPVIAAQRGSLQEVVGSAGVMVEHGDAGALADAMWNVMTSHELRDQLRRHGWERVVSFSWEYCALATIAVYESVLGRRKEPW